MITREEMLSVMAKKKRQSSKAVKQMALRTIERASKAIKNGVFMIPTGPTDPEVFNLVQKSFKKEGINVTMELREYETRSKKNKIRTCHSASYRFSIIEEQ